MPQEQEEPGRDAAAPTDSRITQPQPDPAYAGAPAPEAAREGVVGRSRPTGAGTTAPQPPGPHSPGPPYGAGPYPPQPAGPHYVGAPWAPAPEALRAGRPARQRTMTGIVAAALVAGVIGGAGGFGGAYLLLSGGPTASPLLTTAPSASAPAVPGSVAAAAATALPSTVDIQVPLGRGRSEGSGVILTADGTVLTNNHVVSGASGPIIVTLADGSMHPATVVGAAPSYDIAVIKLQGVSGLTPATLGNSADLKVGQDVVAIGSPQGLTGTVTAGIVSAVNRTVAVQAEDGSSVVYNGLQTDAPINPGNSGGPLVDLSGHVVGIDSAIATASSAGGGQGGSIGLGFAIPVDQAKRVAQELMSAGGATKPVLGVQGNPAAASTRGAQIGAVQAGSPAAQAGLVPGDVVIKVDDAGVGDFADLVARIGSHSPGDTVTLTLAGGDATRTARVTLGSIPDTAASTSTGGQNTSPFGNGGPFGQRSPFGGN